MDRHSKEFKDLEARWYKKLKKSGFDDIEQDENTLKNLATNLFRNKFNETKYLAREGYYRLAGQFLYDHKFKSHKEKLIWELHAEGLSRPQIVEVLKRKRFKTYAWQVQETVQRLEKEMINKCQ